MIMWKVVIRESSESALIGVGLSVFKDKTYTEFCRGIVLELEKPRSTFEEVNR